MRQPLVLQPVPMRRFPQVPRAIAAGVHKRQEVAVGDVVHVDVERGNLDAMLLEFVVPAKRHAVARGAERRDAGRNAHRTSR
jgi:hypothetical protein